MVYGGSLVGFVGFDSVRQEKRWSEDSIALLKIVGEFFVNALEHRQTEQTLRESEERYKSFSEVTLEGIIFHNKGLLVDANSAFAKMFGYELKELIGKDVIELLALPEYRDSIREKIAAGFNKPYEIMAQRKDGTIIPLEVEVRQAHYKGKILQVASVRDITARKQA